MHMIAPVVCKYVRLWAQSGRRTIKSCFCQPRPAVAYGSSDYCAHAMLLARRTPPRRSFGIDKNNRWMVRMKIDRSIDPMPCAFIDCCL